MAEDIYLKMSTEPVKAVLAEKEEEMIRDGVFARTDPKQWFNIMPFGEFDSIPKAFIDDWSSVWVSLYDIKGFRSCNQVKYTFGPFPYCVVFDGVRFVVEKGRYFIYSPPLVALPISLREAEALFENLENLRERVKDILQNKNKRLLIAYDYSDEMIKIYENFMKAETLRFPSVLDISVLGNILHVSRVPRIKERIPYEIIKNMEIYNFEIKFNKEVVRFKIYTKKGRAEIIYNQNSENVLTMIQYRDCERYSLNLEPHKLYLFSEVRPMWAREEQEEERRWVESMV